MRKVILFFIGVIVIIGAILGAGAISKSNKRVRPKAPKVIKTVFAEQVTNKTIPITITSNGTLLAKNRLELYAEVQGIFQSSSKDFKPGQTYRKGQSLLRINAAEFYASVQASKSDFHNLISSLMPDLRLDYPDAFPEWEQYLNSFDVNKSTPDLPEVNSENVKYFITGRGVYAAYYNLKNLEQRLGKYGITAPFDGVLTEALVTKGTLVRSGQKLGEFIDTSVFEVELAIEKSYSDLLKIGESVALQTLDGASAYTGKVSRVNGRIDQATQTIKVFVEVRGAGLKEGMYLEAQLAARSEENAIEISRKLLVDESEIFIVRDSVLDIIPVNPVHFSEKMVVLKGIPNGTEILTRPIPGAYAGMLVKRFEESVDQAAKTEE